MSIEIDGWIRIGTNDPRAPSPELYQLNHSGLGWRQSQYSHLFAGGEWERAGGRGRRDARQKPKYLAYC